MKKNEFISVFKSIVDYYYNFMGITESEYSQFYAEKITPILDFLELEAVEGSVAWVLNLEGNQQEFIEKHQRQLLYWKMFGILSAPVLCGPLTEWCEDSEEIMSFFRNTFAGGIHTVEETIVKALEGDVIDGVEKYYTKIETRDRTLSDDVNRKMETYNEMEKLTKVDHRFRIAQSVWLGVYKKEFKRYFLNERVGFDKCLLNVTISDIDEIKFDKAKQKSVEKKEEFPRIVCDAVDPNDKNDKPLKLKLTKYKYKRIRIFLSPYLMFEFRRNNSTLPGAGDVYLLRVYVEPDSLHPDLGNLRNYSMEELQERVQYACEQLNSYTGIKIAYEKVTLNNVEINLTFVADGEFHNIIRYVSYYQKYLRKGYVTTEYTTREDDLLLFGGKRKYRHSRMVSTGYSTHNNTIQIKLYDKQAETLTYIRSRGDEAKFELGGKALIRLEYGICNDDQLLRYFGEVLVHKLVQADIEATYQKLTNMFFRSPYEEKYVPESRSTLKKIIAMVDSHSKGGKWKIQLLKEILSEEIWVRSTPALINEQEIDKAMLEGNATFKRHPKKYIKEIREVLTESEIYKKDQVRAYDRLYNFLRKTSELEGLSRYRRIGYAIADERDWFDRTEEVEEKEQELKGIIGEYYNPNNI